MNKMMRKFSSTGTTFVNVCGALMLVLLCALSLQAQQVRNGNNAGVPEQRAARFFESIRKSPPQMLAFLLRMPKVGDLHNHLSGSVYAESYVQWAAAKDLCVNQ